jgi:hypothetical protein
MSEIEQLKERIRKSGSNGVLTARIRDDYEPAGDMMIQALINSGDFVTRRYSINGFSPGEWRIFAIRFDPYGYPYDNLK